MASKDAWEEILELARRIDDGVAARRGVDPNEAMELVRAVVAFQARLAGAISGPGPGPGPGTPEVEKQPTGQVGNEQAGGQ